MRPGFRPLIALFATVMLGGSLPAQGTDGPQRPICAPCPESAQCLVRPCPPDGICEASVRPCRPAVVGAQRVSSHVQATLDGRIVRYEIEDRYINHGGRPAEVDYVLPLPKGAAFENLELSINGEMVAGDRKSVV